MKKTALIAVICLILLLFGCDSNKDSLQKENNNYLQNSEKVSVSKYEDFYSFKTNSYSVGIIFIGKGGVDPISYAPLLHQLAEEGYAVFLPLSSNNFDVTATKIFNANSNISQWYIGGHSTGGFTATNYLKNSNIFNGLFLLSSYSAIDLSNKNIKVLSIYGENDKILDKTIYQTYYANLGMDCIEQVISGGNHSYFGNYGIESGDGEASISAAEQRKISIKLIKRLIQREPINNKPIEPEIPALATPKLSVDENGLASWNTIENAIYYKFQIDEENERTTTALSIQLKDGQTIKVKAVGDGTNYLDSEYTLEIKYIAKTEPEKNPIKLSTPIITINENGLVSWNAIENASNYIYQINNNDEQITSNLYVQLQDGQTIKVKALGDGINYVDSEYSTNLTYTTPVIPDPVELDTPVVTINEDGLATWSTIENAIGYEYIINNQTIQTTTTTIFTASEICVIA